MPKGKKEKAKIVEDLREKIKKSKTILFLDFFGLNSKDFLSLRKKIKNLGNEIKVAKKTLFDLAFKKEKFQIEIKKFQGQLAIAFGKFEDFPLIKTIFEFSKSNPNLKILGGFLEKKFFETKEIEELANLPTKEELLKRLLGSFFAPISNLINVLKGNLRNFVFLLSQIKAQ